MIKETDIVWAKEQLQKKAHELDRLPHKDDFDEVTRSRIKAFLGPWPRALEAAGLKEVSAKVTEAKGKKRSGSAKAQRMKGLQKLEKSRKQNGGNR